MFPWPGLYQGFCLRCYCCGIPNQISHNSCSVKDFIPGYFGNVNRRGRQALSPHGEEAYKDLICLNDAYKRAIIDSQGHEKSSCDVEISLNSLLWNRSGLNICFSQGGQYEKSYSRSYLRFTPGYRFFFFSQSCHFWNEEHVSGEGKWIYVRDNVFPLTSSMLYIVMSQNKKAKPYRNSFVDCIVLEIYETVYGQTSRFVAAGLLVTISKKLPLYPYSKIQLNPTRNPNSKIQLEILIRKLVCLVSSRLQKL